MSRIRTIKPDFWTDEKVVTISPLARLVFIGLWNFVDDFGRIPCSPVKLKMQILPADNADFPQLLAEISGSGLITIYAVDGKQYLQVNGFEKHQKIDKRTISKHPAPPISPDPRPNSPLEGKGMEGKGMDSADAGASRETESKQVYDLGKSILGEKSGGFVKKLIDAKDGNLPLTMAALHSARATSNPREYLGAIIRNKDSPANDRFAGRAF